MGALSRLRRIFRSALAEPASPTPQQRAPAWTPRLRGWREEGTLPGWQVQDPGLAGLAPRLLDPALFEALRRGTAHTLLQPAAPSVYRLPLFRPEACALLRDELDRYEADLAAEGLRPRRPNSMNDAGVLLVDMGLASLAQNLLERVVAPLALQVFPDHARLRRSHGFVVRYGEEHDLDLDLHVDDADVTLNLSLGGSFEGGALQLEGLRCPLHRQSPPRPDEIHTVGHRAGEALLHLGAHRHRALSTRSGLRSNLIVWCRSDQPLADRCAPWCGEHDTPARR